MNNNDVNIKMGVELDAKISDVQKQLDKIMKNMKANTTLAIDYTKSKSEIQKQTNDIAKYMQTEFNKIAKVLKLPELTDKDSLKYAKDYVNQYVKLQKLQAKADNSKQIREEKELLDLKKREFEYEQKRRQSLKEGKIQSDEYKYQQLLNQAYKEAEENVLREKEYLAQRNTLLAEGKKQAKEYANIQAKTDKAKQIQEEKEILAFKKEQFEYEQKRKQFLAEGSKQNVEYKNQQELITAYKEADEYMLREKEYITQRNALIAEGKQQQREYNTEVSKASKIDSKISNGQILKDLNGKSGITTQYNNLSSTSATVPDSLKADYQTLLTLSEKLNTSMSNKEKIAVWDQYQNTLKSVKNQMSVVNATTQKLVSEQKKLSTADSLSKWITNNSKATKMFGTEINSMITKLRSGANITDTELKQLTTRIAEIKLQARDFNKLGFSFGDKIKNVWEKFGGWSLVTGSMMQGFSKVKEAVTELKTVDTILTEITKTSNATEAQIKKLGEASFDAASKYGRKASDYLTSVQEMNRSGFQGKQGTDMAEQSIMAQSAGDMTEEIADKWILATNAAYEYEGEAKRINAVLDGANNITNKNSVNMTDMAEAMSTAGSMASQTGVAVEQLSALIGTAVAKTKKEGSEIGTGLKSIFINLQNTQSNKIVNTFKALNISMTETVNGVKKLKTPIALIKELSSAYNSLPQGSVDKQNILTNIGGKHHANTLSAILSGYSDYEKMLQDYSDGTGSAAKEAEKSANNWEGSLNKLSNTWTKFVSNFANSEGITAGIKGLNGLLTVIDKLISSLGGLGTIGVGASTVGIVSFIKNLDQLKDLGNLEIAKGIISKTTDFNKVSDAVKILGNESKVAALSTSTLAEEQKILILKNQGLTAKELKTIVTTNALSASEEGATVATGTLGTAVKGLGASLKALALAHPILTAIAVGGTAIFATVKIFDALTISVDEANESIETIQTSINDINTNYKTHADLVLSVSARYQELSKGVNAVNNKNISLSDEDYTEFLDITNQLADAFPELQRTLDANGNSVLKFSNNSKSVTENLKDLLKAEQESTQIEVASHVDELFENLKTLITTATASQTEYNAKLAETEERIKKINAIKGMFSQDGFVDFQLNENGVDNSYLQNIVNDSISRLQEELKGDDLLDFQYALQTDGIQFTGINTSNLSDDLKQKIQDSVQQSVDYFNSDILPRMNDDLSESFDKNKKVQDDMALKWLDFIPSAVAKMKSMPSFQSLGDELGEQVTTIFSNLDASTLNDINSAGTFEDYVYQLIGYVNTDKNKQEFQNAFKQLTAIDPTDSSSLNKQKIDRYANEIAAILHEDVDKIKLAFGFDETAIKQNAEQAIQDVADTVKTTLSTTIDDLNKNYKPAFDALQKAYQNIFTYDDKGKRQFSLENFDLSAIDSIKSAMKSMKGAGLDVSTKAFNNLVSTLSDSTSTADDVQKSFNKMSTSIASNLDDINSSNAGLVESFLKSSGVTNAHEVVQNQLIATQEKNKNSTEALATATNDMADGVWDSSNAFLEEANMTDLAKSQLADLIATEKIFGNTALNLDDKIQQLNNLANAYLGVKNVISTPSGMGTDSRYGFTEESIQKQWNKALKKNNTQLKFDGISEPKSSSSNKSSNKSSDKSGSKTKATSEEFDFIEKKLDRLQTKLDKFKTKAEDTTRTTSARLVSYDDAEKQAKANIDANQKAYDIYMKKAKSAAKKGKGKDLTPEWINKIQNGSYDIDEVKDDKFKTKIENYQKWYDKAQKTKDTIDTLKKSEDELAKGKIETQIKGYEETADKFADANEKIKNSIEAKGKANSSDYAQMNSNILGQIDSIYQQIDAEKELQNNYKKGSEEWDTYASKIRDLKGDVDNLTASMKANAEAAANLINDQADKYRDDISSNNGLLDAQLANANGSGAKNNLLNDKLGNIDYQKSINSWAVSSNADYLSSKGKDLANTDVSGYVNSNQLIPPEVLGAITDPTLYDKCVNYNAALNAYNTSVATEKLYNETSKKDTNDIWKEQFDNVTADFESRLANNNDAMRKKQAEIDKREAMGIGQSKQQYQEQISLSEQRQQKLEKEKQELTEYRDGMMATGLLSQDIYDAMTETINGVDSEIDDCIVDQINFNSAIENMDLSNLKALGELLDKVTNKYDKLKSLREAQGGKLTDEEILGEIENNTGKIDNAQAQQDDALANMKKIMSEKYNFTPQQFNELFSLMESGKWEKVDEYLTNNGVGANYEQLIDFRKSYDDFTSGGSDKIDAKISNETLLNDLYDLRIDKINEYLEQLQKEKDVKDRIFALEQARYNLDKAKNNLTKKVWNGEQWVYTSDKEAVKSAQKSLDDTVYSEYVNALNDNTEALKQAQKDNNMYDDKGNQILTLADISGSVNWADKLVPIQDDFKDWINKFDLANIGKNINVTIPDYSSMLANGNAVGNTYHFDKLAIECPNITDSSTEEKIYKVLDDVARDLSSYATQQNHIN